MRPFGVFLGLLLALVVLLSGHQAQANFHLMQIEQVIGGVNGDVTAQAVQLRMRAVNQHLVSAGRLSVVDATGANQIVLNNMNTNVAIGSAGSRVLLATANFANYMDTGVTLVPDFVMSPIPESYLAAGQLRFTNGNGTIIYWSLSWGGAGFTGSTAGDTANDNNTPGNFGPPWPDVLPSTTLQALQFTGTAGAESTSNNLQYAVTAGAATFVNNAGTSFVVTVPAPPGLPGDYNGDDIVDAADYTVWRNNEGTDFDLAGNGDEEGGSAGIVDEADYEWWRMHYGDVAEEGSGAGFGSEVPEPAPWLLLSAAATWRARRRPRE